MAKNQNTDNTRCWQCGAGGALIYCWWECKMVVTLVDNLALSYTTNILLPYDPAIVFLSIYPKELKIISTQEPVYGYYRSVIHNCRNMAAIKMSLRR